MPPKRFTANPARPQRYFPGQAPAGAEVSSSDDFSDEDSESGERQQQQQQKQQQSEQSARKPAPKASSFPKQKLTREQFEARKQSEEARKRKEWQEERAEQERREREAGFVTESESESEADSVDERVGRPENGRATSKGVSRPGHSDEDDEEGEEEDDEEGESEEESSEEESSDSDDRRRVRRPVFVKRSQRTNGVSRTEPDPDAEYEKQQQQRKEVAQAYMKDRLEKDAALREAGRKAWDDDAEDDEEDFDDTDDLNAELERQQWVARELSRIKRGRAEVEKKEAEIAEIERRRNLSQEEREAEDREFLEGQKEERQGKGKMEFMQKYYHKGAFYLDEAEKEGLLNRDLMGARFEDQTDLNAVPEYLRVRDATKIGRKGRSRYKDMRSEDTGQWGDVGLERDRRGRDGHGRDGPSGANAVGMGERKRGPDDRRGEDDSKRQRTR